MMSLAGIDKGKKPVMDRPESFGEEVQAIKDDGGASGAEPSQVVEGKYSCLSFTELLAQEGNLYSGLEKMKEDSDGEKSGASVSISTKSGKRGSSQLPNLDLSLLPSRESFELFQTPRKITAQANQWPPFSGFHPPCFGGVSPVNINAFSNQQQQESTQLTIFYGGTVCVYNVSADMAKAIMMLASSGVNSRTTTPTSFCPATPACSTPIPAETMCSTPLPTGRGGHMQPTFTLKAANLPISRKISLQRFLEKRNDRLHARAPYANANNAPLGQN